MFNVIQVSLRNHIASTRLDPLAAKRHQTAAAAAAAAAATAAALLPALHHLTAQNLFLASAALQ